MSYPAPEFNRHVGALIRDARVEAELTQGELADRLGVDRSAIAHWELGHTLPRLDTYNAVCRVLGIDTGALAVAS